MEPRNILVVDDEEVMRIALAEALGRAGHNVTTAADGEEGFRMFVSTSPHLVISDVRMPALGGLELLRRVRGKNPSVPFVLITAYGSVEDAVEAMKMGATDYLLKPFSADTLDEMIERLFENGDSAQPKATQAAIASPPRARKNVRAIITSNQAMLRALEMAKKVAPSKSTVLIQGESGTGKELMARYIHINSKRKSKPFVAVNCAAMPESLLESELFGHEKGSFTGAMARKIGKFEMANHGSILLDEITEMNHALQAKLLRVLQESEIDRVGGQDPVQLDLRVIATTNRNIKKAVENGVFREDLYFRLNVIPVTLPPLRERVEDIALLTEFFIRKFNALTGKTITGLEPGADQILKTNPWKGNVRELENVIERAVLLATSERITIDDLMMENADGKPARLIDPDSSTPGITVAEMERRLIHKTLDSTGGNRTKAAQMLGVSIRTLRNKLNEYKNPKESASGGNDQP